MHRTAQNCVCRDRMSQAGFDTRPYRHKLIHFQLKRPGVWLKLGIGRPIVTNMLILAGNLAAITSSAL